MICQINQTPLTLVLEVYILEMAPLYVDCIIIIIIIIGFSECLYFAHRGKPRRHAVTW